MFPKECKKNKFQKKNDLKLGSFFVNGIQFKANVLISLY
jgi:hypothetical protein